MFFTLRSYDRVEDRTEDPVCMLVELLTIVTCF